MEKKSRKGIIIGVTVLLLVTLILIGLTYAYYRTRIIGNPNTESINVTSKKLEITYADKTANINASGIEPSDEFTKEFTVTNTGDGVVSYGVYLEDVVNEFKRTEDLTVSISCTSNKGTCNGLSEIEFPKIDALLVTNELQLEEVETYTLTFKYKNLDVDQSEDMGKALSARIQIYDLTTILGNEETLAYNIVNNVMSGTGTTVYRVLPLSIPGQEGTTIQTQKIGYTSTEALVDAQYYTYASEVEFNELSGYSLVNPQVDTWANIKSNPSKLASFKYLRRESGVATAPIDENGNPSERTQTIKDMVRVDSTANDTLTYTMLELASSGESAEKTMSATKDDYGMSFYYRGDVEDNYVTYNGMCWRIVRVQGDGSIKLFLESSSICSDNMPGYVHVMSAAYYGADYIASSDKYVSNYLNPTYKPEESMRTVLNNWLTDNNFDTTDLKQGDWCLGNLEDAYNASAPYNKLTEKPKDLIASGKEFNYEEYNRLYRIYPEYTTLKCSEKALKAEDDYIGALTIDEAIFAGHRLGVNNSYYLTEVPHGWYTLTSESYLSLVPRVFGISGMNSGTSYAHFKTNIRPSIVLNSAVTYKSGNGTINSPYFIN